MLTLPRESGYVLTADGLSSIALCGGWEMSTTCRRGTNDGENHVSDFKLSAGAYWCSECDMPLHPIDVRPKEAVLMSIEHHVIEEEPW